MTVDNKIHNGENTEKEENLQKPKPANENARLHQLRIIT